MFFSKKPKQTKMEMEILEQSSIIGSLISKYVENYAVTLDMPLIVRQVKIIASGSSYNCGLVAKTFFEKIAQTDTEVIFSGEFICSEKTPDKAVLYFFISQSGETYDTTLAARKVKEAGARAYAIVNNENSTLWELCDYKININAKVENSIAATKSFSASICALYLCALKIAQNKLLDTAQYLKNIDEVQKNIESVLDLTLNIDKAAEFLSKYKAFSVIGQGANYALARECALKIKETSYIDANSCSMGEFLHGHIAILNKIDTVVEIITSNFCNFEIKTLDKINDDYGPKSVVITDCQEKFCSKIAVVFPYSEDLLTRILSVVFVVQMLSLKIALILNRNVDKPHGLSKVVS